MNSNKNLQVYHSNNLDYLAQILCKIMKTNPLKNVFEKEVILVQSAGMRDWVNNNIANYNGISMQIDISLAWAYVWQLFSNLNYALEANNPQQRFKLENMVWNIFSILYETVLPFSKKNIKQEDIDKDPFFSIINYVIDKNNSVIDQVKLFQLSESIAQTFDSYMLYRSEWLISNRADYEQIFAQLNKFVEHIPNNSNQKEQKLNTKFIKNKDLLEHLWKGISVDNFKTLDYESKLVIRNNIWQVILWQKIIKKNKSQNYITNVIQRFIKELPTNLELQKKLPSRIFIFGVSSLPPIFIQLLRAIGSYSDVFFMFFNPCKEYWGDRIADGTKKLLVEHLYRIKKFVKKDRELSLINGFDLNDNDTKEDLLDLNGFVNNERYAHLIYTESEEEFGSELQWGNSLLNSWGKQGRDMLFELIEAGATEYEVFEDPYEIRPSLLSAIQSDILHMAEVDPYRYIFSKSEINPNNENDETRSKIPVSRRKYVFEELEKNIDIHISYSKMREVQVLYDAILDKFEKNAQNNIKPSDIIVMVPNINDYAPYIKAVFGDPYAYQNQTNKKAIPYQISDLTYDKESNFIQTFISLLNITTSRIDGDFVLNILKQEHIQKKFELDEEDIDVIENWIDEACIRYDYDETEIPGSVAVYSTWHRAFKRLIVGSVMSPEYSDLFYDEIRAFNNIGDSSSIVLGKLKLFVESLATLRTKLRAFSQRYNKNNTKFDNQFENNKGQSVSEWCNFIKNDVIDIFFVNDDNSTHDISNIYKILNNFEEYFKNLEPLSVEVFAKYLSNSISSQKSFTSFMAGKVNFCSLVPMRSIPFKHVFILGLGDGLFPRVDDKLGFNLMKMNNSLVKRGDRSNRNDDRYLFLEAILSAKESLYLSYVGKSSTNDTDLNPSVILSEFINYIKRTFVTKEDNDQILKILGDDDGSNSNNTNVNGEKIALLFELYKKASVNIEKLLCHTDTLSPTNSMNYIKVENGKEIIDEKTLYSYQDQWCINNLEQKYFEDDSYKPYEISTKYLFTDTNSNSQEANITIEISDLANFITDPELTFINKRLNCKINKYSSNANFKDECVSLEENSYNENYEYIIPYAKQHNFDLFDQKGLVDHNKLRDYEVDLFHSGRGPVGKIGKEVALEDIDSKFEIFVKQHEFFKARSVEKEIINVDIFIDFSFDELPTVYKNYENTDKNRSVKVRLRGTIDCLYKSTNDDSLIYFDCSNPMQNDHKFKVKHLLNLLCLKHHSILPNEIHIYRYDKDKNVFKPLEFKVNDLENIKMNIESIELPLSMDLLKVYVWYYLLGMQTLIPNLKNTSSRAKIPKKYEEFKSFESFSNSYKNFYLDDELLKQETYNNGSNITDSKEKMYSKYLFTEKLFKKSDKERLIEDEYYLHYLPEYLLSEKSDKTTKKK